MMSRVQILFVVIAYFIINQGYSQQLQSENYFENLTEIYPQLDEMVRIDMQGLTLYELITTIADENELNVSADYSLDDLVDSNFYNISIKDLFQFLVRRYDLKVERINDVLVFSKKEVMSNSKAVKSKPLDIKYDKNRDLLSVNFKNDSIQQVARSLTDVSGRNIVLAPQAKNRTVSAYILNRSFDQVVTMLAASNDLDLKIDDNGFYVLDIIQNQGNFQPQSSIRGVQGSKRTSAQSRSSRGSNMDFSVSLDEAGFLNINASEVSVSELIQEVASLSNVNYFMLNRPDDINATLIADGISFETFLDNVFEGTSYAYTRTDQLYLIGQHTTSGIRRTELVQLENRTVEKLIETLPQTLIQGLEVNEFWDLNGFIVSGSNSQILEFKEYINQIDRVVPVIQIEVMIVQYQKGYEVNTGFQLGLDDEPRTTTGVLLPSTDMTFSSQSVNELINAFNGLGWVNLGKVTKEFYASLRAMENNSIINITSTPKLVTLNGHQATSSIGETNYYFEQNNRLINSGINDNILQSGIWKATDANLSVNIRPFVSRDEQITLQIRVEKNSFLGRAGENAPPGKATQSFESIIRVKNNEMVLLGGLDELERENSGSGTPLISRIPIIKWFFSNRVKKREKSKLHLFIKPTVIY